MHNKNGLEWPMSEETKAISAHEQQAAATYEDGGTTMPAAERAA